MAARTKNYLVRSVAVGLLMLSAGVSRLQSMVPAGVVSGRTGSAVRRAPHAKRSPRLSGDECSTLALKATIAKARAEMRALVPGASDNLAGISAAMTSDRRLSERVQQAFGNSDVIKSEYSPRGDCVVTLKLPLDRLQLLARGL
jgi:hypothetical protein